MPDWLIQVIVQYPIVAMVGFVAWYANREIKQQTRHFQAREDKHHAETARARQELSEFKDKILDQSHTLLRTEIKRLTRAVEELTKRLGA